jgi:co-chaperonin GroES (HSP10)
VSVSVTNPSSLLGDAEYKARFEQAFPDVDPGVTPFGARVLVQIRTAVSKTKGGIILTEDTRDTDKWNTQIARVIAVGPGAFKDRSKGEVWPEGDWCKPGEFVRVGKYGGDRWEVAVPGRDPNERAMFVIFNDYDLIGLVTGDPLGVKAFLPV